MLANAEVSCNFYITAQKLISWKYVLKNEIICQHILACYSGAKMAVCFMTEKILWQGLFKMDYVYLFSMYITKNNIYR